MARYEYCTLFYSKPKPKMCSWVITAKDAETPCQPVGELAKPRFSGRIWQALHQLETALRELDDDGWELVSTSFSGIYTFYGTAVLKRPAQKGKRI